jgi:hypothetical protein
MSIGKNGKRENSWQGDRIAELKECGLALSETGDLAKRSSGKH